MKQGDKYDMQFIHHIFNKHKIPAASIIVSVLMLVVHFISTTQASFAPGTELDPNCTPGSIGCTVTAGGSTISGLTQNYLSKSNAAGDNIINSQIFDNGTNIGIGTATPTVPLQVKGTSAIPANSGSISTAIFRIDPPAKSVLDFGITGGASWMQSYTSPSTDLSQHGIISMNPNGGYVSVGNNSGSFSGDATLMVYGSSGSTLQIKDGNQANGYVLTSDANGQASWQTASGGGGFTIDGNDNMFAGTNAGDALSSGDSNFFAGIDAGKLVTTGKHNTFIGFGSGAADVSGHYNTAVGQLSLNVNTGPNNSAFGRGALRLNVGGEANTATGVQALETNTSGNENSGLGAFADVASSGLSNATAVGAYAIAGASNSLILGQISGVGGGSADTKVGIGTSTPGARLHVKKGTIQIDGTGAPATGGALCLNSSARISKCTSAVDGSGNCTCP